MIRLFETHRIRKCRELSSSLWRFQIPGEEGPGEELMVPVPGCWETYPQTLTYRGKASFERIFEAGGNVRLAFEGVSYSAEVYLDGEPAVRHDNAYTPFDAVVCGLKAGKHRLSVVADNSYRPGLALHFPNDYQSYGGITRGVMLEELPDAYITQMHFTPVRTGDRWQGSVEICFQNLSGATFSGSVELTLMQESGPAIIFTDPVVIPAGENRVIRTGELDFPDVRCWHPEAPVLYELWAVLKDENGVPTDDLIDRIGFREVRTEGSRILLNGQPFQVRGFCRHEDHPDFGCAIPFQVMHHDLLLMKDLGANAVRTVHYPNDPLFLDLCDELGMFVWEEGHARALTEAQMRAPEFMEQSLRGILEMVSAHYNHPSVCIWGFLNECASDTLYGRDCYQKHYDLIRSLDRSRPCSFASCRKETDVCLGIPDIVSYNIYPEWYESDPAAAYIDRLFSWIERDTLGAGKPFLITEIGAGAIYGYRSSAHVKWSEEYQVQAIGDQLKAVLGNERCSGVFIWQFCDVRVSDEWFFSRPRTMNNKGIFDEYRRPKPAAAVVRELYHMPAPGGHDTGK